MKHNRVTSFIKTPVYLVKEYFHRRPYHDYQCDFVRGEKKSLAATHVETLRQEGIVILPAYFKPAKMDEFRAAFEKATRDRPNKYTPDSFYNDDIMHVDPALMDAALDDFLLEIIGTYFQRPFGLALAAATRLLPTPPIRHSSYRWHHDARGKQMNLMVFLSDVTAKGQRMSYLRRSHNRYYSHYRGITNPLFDNDVFSSTELHERIIECIGPSGTVAMFDSNGLHSGNRNDVEGRDTLNINYVSYRHFKKVSCRRRDLLALSAKKREVMTFNPRLEQLE